MFKTISTLTFITFFIFANNSFGQNTMIPIDTLLKEKESEYAKLHELFINSKNHIELLPKESTSSDVLFKTQVSAGSALGAVIYNTGGILVDSGWIRILGSGSANLKRSIIDWNIGKSIAKIGDKPTFLLIADDVIGGFFAINGGALGSDLGNVYYFAPDDLSWFPMEISYSQFLEFCFAGDIQTFYKGSKWKSDKQDVSKLTGDQVLSFYPPLWSKEGSDINKTTKTVKDVEVHYIETLKTLEMLNQKNNTK